VKLSSAVATHPGLRRAGNEDAYCVRPDLGLFLVADGMGGHAAGEVASQLAVEVIESFIAESRAADAAWAWPLPYDPEVSLSGNRLAMAFRLANRRLASAMASNLALRGMATTAAAVLVDRDVPVVAHVGDSRVYLWRGGQLRILTQDHSWVGEQVRAGVMSESEARRHPWRNVVTRAIGAAVDPDVDVANVAVEAGDRVLLCSDGLSGVVAHEQLEQILAAGRPLDDTCLALIDAANEAGGPDNVTALMIQIDVA
jgi:protein phosphatase